MKKYMYWAAALSLAGLLASGIAWASTGAAVLYPAAITFGTIFYHFSMRLAVGWAVDARFHNRMDHTRRWFQERPFERRLYQRLGVRKWKKWVPTFDPQTFDFRGRSAGELIGASCQAEVIHEIIMALSFVPVLFSLRFGDGAVFLLTSCAAALVDSIFVILQRFNRPRLMRLAKKQIPAIRP